MVARRAPQELFGVMEKFCIFLLLLLFLTCGYFSHCLPFWEWKGGRKRRRGEVRGGGRWRGRRRREEGGGGRGREVLKRHSNWLPATRPRTRGRGKTRNPGIKPETFQWTGRSSNHWKMAPARVTSFISITVMIIQFYTFVKTFITGKLYCSKPETTKQLEESFTSFLFWKINVPYIHRRDWDLSVEISGRQILIHINRKKLKMSKKKKWADNHRKYENQSLNDPAKDAVKMALVWVWFQTSMTNRGLIPKASFYSESTWSSKIPWYWVHDHLRSTF